MDDKRGTPAAPSDASERDAEPIAAEVGRLAATSNPFVAAVRTTRMPMIVTNPRLPDNPVVFANDAFCRLTGYARDEIVGRNCRFLQGPDTDRDSVREIHDAVRSEQPLEIDIRNYTKQGRAFWNRLLLAPVRDEAGQLAYFFASQVDVTWERERLTGLESDNAALTTELAAQLEAQRFALEAGRLGSWTLDVAAADLKTSALFRAMLGCDPKQPLAWPDFDAALHPDDRPRIHRALQRSVEEQSDLDIEVRVPTGEGGLRWIALRGRPVGPGATAARLSGVSLDLTEQRRAGALRQGLADLGGHISELQSVAELSAAAGHILGQTLQLVRAGFARVEAAAATVVAERDWTSGGPSLAGRFPLAELGLSAADLARGDVLFPDVADRGRGPLGVRPIVVPVVERGVPVALLHLQPATARTWHADEIAFVREMAERIWIAVVRRGAEQAAAALATSLEEKVADRTAALMQAEEALRQSQKMEAIGQLTGGVAHDFNNLLTVIRSSVDLMRRPDLPEERRRRYMDAISETVNRAAKLTGQLLAFARRQALKPEAFDVSERLRGVAEMVDAVTGARVGVVVEVEVEACFVRADVSQFETALVNMAVNARDAMDGTGTLRLGLRRVASIPAMRGHAAAEGCFAAISLTDTGEGIPAHQIARIFEPFFTTKAVGKGTGLGLSQVFGFAKQSGGDVGVSSAEGRGATFTLYLPEVDRVPVAGPEVAPAAGAMPGGGGRRVLVVEDNLDVGRFSTQVLQDLGYDTIWATSAEDALAKLDGPASASFDVVFSDVVMPGMSGIELGKEVQRRHPGLPIVLTSGYSHVLAEEGSHGFDLLQKPYSAEQLSHVLRRAARPRPAH